MKFSENQSAPKLENRKTSPCSPCAPNLLHVLLSRTTGYHNLCSPESRLSLLLFTKVGNYDDYWTKFNGRKWPIGVKT